MLGWAHELRRCAHELRRCAHELQRSHQPSARAHIPRSRRRSERNGPDGVGRLRADRHLDETRIDQLPLIGERPHLTHDLAKPLITSLPNGKLRAHRQWRLGHGHPGQSAGSSYSASRRAHRPFLRNAKKLSRDSLAFRRAAKRDQEQQRWPSQRKRCRGWRNRTSW